VSRPPDFDELLGGIDQSEERERLRRVHELLLEVGPPPELSPALSSPPLPKVPRRSRRRLVAGLAFAAALVAATFGVGYLAGSAGDDDIAVRDAIALSSASGASGVVNLGVKGADGNWPMVVEVRGLEPLRGGDYYELALTKDGKPRVTCGTFNVADRGEQTIEMSAAYNLEGFDGWVVLRYDAKTHHDTVVLQTAQI
jgi:hypothetical protein